ncbi:hypothetical protein [Ensifer sp. NM-2]|uniref:hypothetical protein n=1 Tax=Ensifer sp. NM-2 TaxID=2109730 RepID=UPI000D139837|nr:hypothetical protein [Ensifer sp. NM-2]
MMPSAMAKKRLASPEHADTLSLKALRNLVTVLVDQVSKLSAEVTTLLLPVPSRPGTGPSNVLHPSPPQCSRNAWLIAFSNDTSYRLPDHHHATRKATRIVVVGAPGATA